jgi:hypothetical protein
MGRPRTAGAEPAQPLGGLGHQPTKPPRRAVRAHPVVEQLGGPLDRQVLAHQQVGPKRADPRPVARRRARHPREHPSGDVPAGARSPLGPMLTHPQPHPGQIEHLPGLHPGDRRQGQIPTTATAHSRPVDNHLVRVGRLGQVRARRTGLLAGARPPPPRRCCRGAGGLPSPSDDGGLEELEESLPRRRSSSATRAASAALASTSLALASRNWLITIAWTATVASRSRSGEEITASWTTSSHARLPMGLWDSYRTPPQQVNPPTARRRACASRWSRAAMGRRSQR